jgi:hypothetical protein
MSVKNSYAIRLGGVVFHQLSAPFGWCNFKERNLDIARVLVIKQRQRRVCLFDRTLPYTVEIAYYNECDLDKKYEGSFAHVPTEIRVITTRYASKESADKEVDAIKNKMAFLDQETQTFTELVRSKLSTKFS